MRFLLLVTMFVFSGSAFAGSGTGVIERVLVQQPNFVFVSVGDHVDAPACQGGSDDFSIDISTTLGKSQYAFLLTHQALGTEIRIVGTGECTTGPGRESLNFVFSQ